MVSVIIPNYNHYPYLHQRIESVLNQTWPDFEVIILDDCSTDDSRKIIEGYRGHDKISHIVFNEINSGNTFKQWQKGIALAKGEYIWIAESDDWCEPFFLETLVSGMEANENCVLAYAQSSVMDDKGNIDKTSTHHNLMEYVVGKQYIPAYLVKQNAIFNASMAIFKKECYTSAQHLITDFKFCGDWRLWIAIAGQGDVFISGKVANYFRKHKDDITGPVHATGYNYIEETEILKILKGEGFIDGATFKAQLLDLYTGYFLNRQKFTKGARTKIEEVFYFAGNESFKQFLTSRVNQITVTKLKTIRRIKRLIE